jgi:SAM-dependent methyltransferase
VSQEIIRYYSEIYDEGSRVTRGEHRFEFLRTREIISRYLDGTPLTVVDAGSGTGPYARWLTGLDHRVHLLDLTPRHVAAARRGDFPPVTAVVGNGCRLPYPTDSADLGLLLGPLYHLIEEMDRLAALREMGRVIRPGGLIFAAAISRFASLLDTFRRETIADEAIRAVVDADLATGVHRSPPDRHMFTTAYFHRPDELRREVENAELLCEVVLAIEGPLILLPQFQSWVDDGGPWLERLLRYAARTETEESLLGATAHLLAVARVPRGE